MVYLYGNSPTWDIKLEQIHENEYNLYVPIMDCYEMLSPKMEMAYRYFQTTECNGILKVDDDIIIFNKGQFTHYILPAFIKYDYVGGSIGEFGIYKGAIPIAIKKYTLNMFKKMLLHADTSFPYFSGPFYWVSKKVINSISSEGLELFYEDASVGYIVHKHNNISSYSFEPTYFKSIVYWNNDTEP